MGKTMRKFSNKSKKEKKNAIRRKTKDNRRNNKRRTYRKKVKGGDFRRYYHKLNHYVNELRGYAPKRPLENKAIAQIKNILDDIIKLYITFINNPSKEKTKGELVTKLDEMTNTGKRSCSDSTVMEGKDVMTDNEAYNREYYECEKQKYIAYATASYLASEIKNTYNDLEYKMDKIITKLDNIKKAKMDTMNKIFPQTRIQKKEDEYSLQPDVDQKKEDEYSLQPVVDEKIQEIIEKLDITKKKEEKEEKKNEEPEYYGYDKIPPPTPA